MVPTAQLAALTRARRNASELAEAGQFARGYTCLLYGLHLAKRARAAGQPWADELVRRYHEEVDAYTARFRVPLG